MSQFSDYCVLVADDCEVSRVLATEILTDLGCKEVYEAANGVEAVEIIKNHPVHIVVSDWNMPEMDGTELLRYLRNKLTALVTRFIMVSSEGGDDKVAEAIAFGVDAHITKPVDADKIKNAITSVIDEMQADHSDHFEALKVLLVDDSTPIVLIISDLMETIGVTNFEVSDSVEDAKIKMQASTAPDLVICDWRFPDGDGLELLGWMREQESTRETPFIMVTAERQPEKIREALGRGVNEYLIGACQACCRFSSSFLVVS